MEHAAAERRWDIPTSDLLEDLLAAPLPLGLVAGPLEPVFYRDLYFDTPEHDLSRRGVSCRVRFDMEDRRWLALESPTAVHCEAAVAELDPGDVLRGRSEPARRLRALVDPERLVLQVELQVERRLCRARLPLVLVGQFFLAYDTITTRRGGAGVTFHELVAWRDRWGIIPLARLQRVMTQSHPLVPASLERVARAEQLLTAQSHRTAEPAAAPRRVAVVAVAHGRMALCRQDAALQLPLEDGAGQDACRRAMRRWFGNAEGEVRLLGVTPGGDGHPVVEVWLARRLRRDLTAAPPAGLQWFAPADIVARVGSPVLRDASTLAALAVAARSELVPEWSAAPLAPDPQPEERPRGTTDELSRLTLTELRVPVLPAKILDPSRRAPDHFINVELSSLEFNARVLALAEDPETPLAARLRFLSIFSTNLDHFFMVEVGALKEQVAAGVAKPSPDGLSPAEQLDAIAIRLRPLVARKYRLLSELARGPLAAAGIQLRDWTELGAEARDELARRFSAEIVPLLTPKALTRAPGHRFPQLADRRLALAVMLRDQADSPVHFAAIELPAALPPFLPAQGMMVPLAAVARHRLGELFPSREVVAAHAFRVTRSGDIHLDELGTASFVQAVAEEVRRRPWGPVVRIEVERDMPQQLRDLLQRELRFEESELHSALGPSDVYEADGPVDLGALDELAAPVSRAGLDYRPFVPRDPFAGHRSIFAALDRGDVLVHHPYDSFAASFERLIAEAADDPGTVAIKLTLYRPGGPSAIGDALRRAAAHGKDVSVFVELKARFDEELNIAWAQSLEAAGIHVITGLATLKTHAKIALVVRREGSRTRRYVHVGSGNYNPDTAKVYTDLGLFTADDGIGEEVHALFNELTGSSRPPQAAFRRLLVAPTNMLDRFLALIARETEHARAGRGGHIQAKLNGLADATVIAALYRASQAGVQIDLVVRGLCMLRPGVPGLSERIQVVSVLGRFLEHARIYRFGNAGAPEYFTGSADWRPRNLRRRVEVITPVIDAAARARLDHILALELADRGAWQLQSDGSYVQFERGMSRSPGSQERLIAEISE
ncbi:MAG TPA: polyphosphate kinase 1 [Gemmatimonadales bacterium]|nr:polyphosphate kinase 1 [Gemmatimonadales bacterium]